MSAVLADTSAWVEFDRATGSPVDRRLNELVSGNGELAVTEPIICEVAAGARTDEREVALRRLLARYQLLPFDSVADLDGAVRVYRSCRRVSITPRGLIDCMIVAVALRYDTPILAHDADMARIAEVMPLRLDRSSPRR